MQLSEIDLSGQRPVDGYGPGFFRIAGDIHRGPLLLLPSGLRLWGGWEDMAARDIDVLLVGCGREITPLPKAFREAFDALGIGVEQMATPSACRSYNMLLAEGRRTGLAAFPV